MAGSLLISALLALGLSQGGQSVQTELAWRGAVSSDAYTELALSVTGLGEPSLAVEAIAPDAIIRTVLELDNAASARGTLPVSAKRFDQTNLRIKAGNSQWQDIDTDDLVRAPAIVVVAGNTAAQALNDFVGKTFVSIRDLPTIPAAYSHIRALALSGDELGQIAGPQLHALLGYISMCGRIMLVDAPTLFTELLQQRAGCDQRFFLATGAADDPTDSFSKLVKSSSDGLPDENTLQRLLDSRRSTITSIALFLGGFLLLFVLLSRKRESHGAALALSAVLAVFAGLYWGGGNRHSLVAWAETTTSDNVARFAAIERISSMGRGAQVLNPDSLERSIVNITGTDIVLNWSEHRDSRYIDWSPSLLQEIQLLSMGSFAAESRLRVDTRDSDLTVCNKSVASTPAGLLRWQGQNYDVPALAPGEVFQLDGMSVTTNRSLQLQMLVSRADRNRPTLLLPLSIPGNGDNQAGWLMTIETDAGGAKCTA